MIVYHPAFDLYHTVYRFLQLLSYFKHSDYVEVDRLRIWDFYLLFPDKVQTIKLKAGEGDVRQLIKTFITNEENPYELVLDNRKMFDKIKPYQIGALKSLASYGLINKEYLNQNRVSVISKEVLVDYAKKFTLSAGELNVIKLMTSHFYKMSMFGKDGLKARTKLLESKYDA